jgi:hypothetical protein
MSVGGLSTTMPDEGGTIVESSTQPERKEEVLMYLADCPDHGPEHRIFNEENIVSAGGVAAIEAELEKQTYRFVRLGVIEVEKSTTGITFTDEDIASLRAPADEEWRLGRISPAFGRSELERQIYQSLVRGVRTFLDNWRRNEDGEEIAYVAKSVEVGCLASLASNLCAFGEAYNVIRMVVMKYWFEPKWKTRAVCEDQILAEFPLIVPVRTRWRLNQELMVSDVQPLHYC